MLYILVCCLFLVGCNGKSNKENHADVTGTVFDAISLVDNETDSLTKLEGENLWKEANRYKASITDTTFLRDKRDNVLCRNRYVYRRRSQQELRL